MSRLRLPSPQSFPASGRWSKYDAQTDGFATLSPTLSRKRAMEQM
ncbi:MAG: hypothetical protein QG662_1743 [Pseudomonadota bacterium]|nr:hypothetical protein [Pseudomonadota bacterium]